jgi:chromosome segregation ATPase
MKSNTETLIIAMRYLSEDIHSEDGVANAAIVEAADRLQELLGENNNLKLELEVVIENQLTLSKNVKFYKESYFAESNYITELYKKLKESEDYANKLIEHIPYLPKDMDVLRESNAELADSNFDLAARNKELNTRNKQMAIELSTLKQKINNFLFEINQGSVKHEYRDF